MRLSGLNLNNIGNNTSKYNSNDHCNNYSSLSLSNLPNQPLNTKFEFIEFSFLFLLLEDSTVRQRINCSRITEQFWIKIKSLDEFLNTFNMKENEMLKIYKYIQYFKTSKYQKDIVVKTFFYLKENKIINDKSSLADISKELQKLLKKISRKNAKHSEDIEAIKSMNLFFYYFEPWNKDCFMRLRLGEKHSIEKPNTESNIHNSTTNSFILEHKLNKVASNNVIELVESSIPFEISLQRNFIVKESLQELKTKRVFEVLKTIYNDTDQNSPTSNNILSDFYTKKKSSLSEAYKVIKAFNVNNSRECVKSYIDKFKQSKQCNILLFRLYRCYN